MYIFGSSNITYFYNMYIPFRDKNNTLALRYIIPKNLHVALPLSPLTLRTRSRLAAGSCSRDP